MRRNALPAVPFLILVWTIPTPPVAARAKPKPLFGPAVAWPRAQNKRSVAVAKRFCHGLSTKPTAPSRRDRTKPAVPEHPGLYWGLTAAKVRWVLARARQPVRLHCFAKTANAYLKQRRRVSKSIRGGPRSLWKVTLYFSSSAPYGLNDILLMSTSMTIAQAQAVLKAARARYGPVRGKPGYRDARSRSTIYTWLRGKTRVRLSLTRSVGGPGMLVDIRYSSR